MGCLEAIPSQNCLDEIGPSSIGKNHHDSDPEEDLFGEPNRSVTRISRNPKTSLRPSDKGHQNEAISIPHTTRWRKYRACSPVLANEGQSRLPITESITNKTLRHVDTRNSVPHQEILLSKGAHKTAAVNGSKTISAVSDKIRKYHTSATLRATESHASPKSPLQSLVFQRTRPLGTHPSLYHLKLILSSAESAVVESRERFPENDFYESLRKQGLLPTDKVQKPAVREVSSSSSSSNEEVESEGRSSKLESKSSSFRNSLPNHQVWWSLLKSQVLC